MGSMFSYSKAAMERAMKVQEVILRTMAKKITWLAGRRKNGGATGYCGRLTKTGYFICYEKGTFLMS